MESFGKWRIPSDEMDILKLVRQTPMVWLMKTSTVVSLVIHERVNLSQCPSLIKQYIWAVFSQLIQSIGRIDVGVQIEPNPLAKWMRRKLEKPLSQTPSFLESDKG